MDGFIFHAHLHRLALDSHRIGTDLDPWIVSPHAVAKSEPPSVPGTGDNAVLNVPAAERSAHVWARIIDGVILTLDVEKRDNVAAGDHGFALTLSQFADATNCSPAARFDSLILRIIDHVFLAPGDGETIWFPRRALALILADQRSPFMESQFEAILKAALALPEMQRVLLIDELVESLPPETGSYRDEEILAELQRRKAELEQGLVKPIPWEEVRQRLWKKD
jgi:putative addiction module component (TIGR02574 family)